jgi:hypothetical protein
VTYFEALLEWQRGRTQSLVHRELKTEGPEHEATEPTTRLHFLSDWSQVERSDVTHNRLVHKRRVGLENALIGIPCMLGILTCPEHRALV